MNPVDILAAMFQKSFDDKLLTKAEKQELQVALAHHNLDQRKRDILRSKVFQIAKGAGKAVDPLFVIDWLEDATRILEAKLEAPAKTSGSRVYFSPGNTCLDAIISVIRAATQKLDVCVFTISDDRISDALIERHRRGIKVRIITDNEKLLDEGSDITKLDKAGIEVKVDITEYHMHHKFMVADEKVAVTGSYNWTRSAAAYNEENILVTEEPAVIRRYVEEFNKMWEKMAPFA